jgi:hypothetical protein
MIRSIRRAVFNPITKMFGGSQALFPSPHTSPCRSSALRDARSLYSIIVQNAWISQLSHPAYLGKEVTGAGLSLEDGSRYIHDGAEIRLLAAQPSSA